MLESLVDRWRTWRYGGVTGLNYVSSNAKMTSVVALPWLAGYLLCFMFIPDPFLEVSIIVMSVIWIVYCYGVYAYAKIDATNYRPFPQSMWRFPDGGTRKFNLMVPPDGFEKLCDFDDGTQGWRINLGRRFQYWDKRSDFPFVFDYALMRLSKDPDGSFSFLSAGEFFHKGIAIKHPACEDVSFYVHDWIQDKDGRYVPVGEINDCTLAYKQALKNARTMKGKELMEAKYFGMAFLHERSRRMILEKHTLTLEKMVESEEKDATDFRKRVDDGINKRRELFKSILDTGKPLIQRIKANLLKIVLIGLGIFVFLWLIGVIRF